MKTNYAPRSINIKSSCGKPVEPFQKKVLLMTNLINHAFRNAPAPTGCLGSG